MREIEYTGKFKRDYKREKRTDPDLADVLQPVLELLAADATLPERLADHGLSGAWKGFRDCHIKPDLVLVYEKPEGILSLARLGSHSEVFG
ncbi:type II toxin-antitoxin system YafQ family toxin [Sphingomonas sp. Ant20]|uniref:type II toxin-antitoxin system RelE/ParE family toxin n=1 Tax=Sphingomonas sp. Ant20 TaxID=104605 RepID=UPI000A05B891|nr:type II toxin-antitoxin system YafQ family toxin [Sphingomonas sp. Ant20]